MHSLRAFICSEAAKEDGKGKASKLLRDPRADLLLMKSSGALMNAEEQRRCEKGEDLASYPKAHGT